MEVDNCENVVFKNDEACVVFKVNDTSMNLRLYSLASECVSCLYRESVNISNRNDTSVVFDSAQLWAWKLYDFKGVTNTKRSQKRNLICELNPDLGHNGVYELHVNDGKCDLDTITSPTNAYTPLIIISGIIVTTLALISLGRYWRNKNPIEIEPKDEAEKEPLKKRILSIDTFRGISILMMIFVNNGAGGYKYLEHATWDGLYVGDIVFPCFIWIMGLCIPTAIASQLSRGIPRLIICRNIIQRSCTLFFLGVCLNTLGTNVQLENIRLFGVLQRFGVAYLVVGLIYTICSKKKITIYEHGLLSQFNEIIALLPQWIVINSILIVHCILTFSLNVPGCPNGYIGPGGEHDRGKYYNCSGGSTGYIDKVILGDKHIYQHPTIDSVYKSGPFDPEGILGCLTTIFQTFLGVQAGRVIRLHKTWEGRVMQWIMLAIFYSSVGCILHFGGYIPVNKNLWSLSFVFVTTAIALGLLTVCYLLVDVSGMWTGGPFRIPGMNALVMYIGHQICYQIFPFHWKVGEMNSHTWKTIAAFWDVGLWTIIAYILHRKRIYITI